MLTQSIKRALQLGFFLSLCCASSVTLAAPDETATLDETRLVTGELEVYDAGLLRFGKKAYEEQFFSVIMGRQGCEFALGGEFQGLEFSFGTPDGGFSTPSHGWLSSSSVTLQLFGDGRHLGTFTHRQTEPPVKVSLDARGVRTLKVQTDYSFVATRFLLRKEPEGERTLEVRDGQVITLQAGTYKIVVKGVVPPTITTTTTIFGIPGGRALPVDPRDIAALAGKLKEQVSPDPTLGALVSSGEKVQVAVAPFLLIPNDLSTTVSASVTEFLSTELIKSGAFKLIERAQLDKVLEELGFQQTGVVDPETAKEIGKITGAATVMVGSVIDQGTYAVITCRLINTETGEATIADSVELRK